MSILQDRLERTEPYWVTYIKNRIAKKKNFLGFISGPTGSGKSWSGLSICFMVDPTFNAERIIMNMRQLIKLINSGLKSGSAILWDEAGVGMSSKDWQSLTNKLINFLMQTFRHKRFVLIFTSPHIEFIDASTRKLFHAELQTMTINYEKQQVRLKPQLIQYNSRMKKFYYKYLRVKTQNKGVAPVVAWHINKPPVWLVEEYERIKLEFTRTLNIDIERQLDAIESEKYADKRKPLTEKQQQILTLMVKYDDVDKVSADLGISPRTIYFHIAQATKKGWKKSEFSGDTG